MIKVTHAFLLYLYKVSILIMKVSEMKKWEGLSIEELAFIVKESKSYREVAAKCGYSNRWRWKHKVY